VSVEIVINLVRVGAFDGFGVRREELLVQVPLVHAQVAKGAGERASETRGSGRGLAVGGFAGPSCGASDGSVLAAAADEALQFATDERLGALPFVPSWSAREKVAVELEVLGLNVSAHPLDFVRAELTALDVVPFGRLHLVPNGRRIRLAGVLERAQMPWIRSGHRTLFLTLEDESGLAEVVVFNDVYLRYGRVLKEAVYLLVEGELQNNDERGLAVVATRIVDLEAVLGRLRDLPPDDRDRALKRSGEWLPNVEPRTRPGRTG
jgi:error-prone DNA polymerase